MHPVALRILAAAILRRFKALRSVIDSSNSTKKGSTSRRIKKVRAEENVGANMRTKLTNHFANLSCLLASQLSRAPSRAHRRSAPLADLLPTLPPAPVQIPPLLGGSLLRTLSLPRLFFAEWASWLTSMPTSRGRAPATGYTSTVSCLPSSFPTFIPVSRIPTLLLCSSSSMGLAIASR